MEHQVPFIDSSILAIGYIGLIYVLGYLVFSRK